MKRDDPNEITAREPLPPSEQAATLENHAFREEGPDSFQDATLIARPRESASEGPESEPYSEAPVEVTLLLGASAAAPLRPMQTQPHIVPAKPYAASPNTAARPNVAAPHPNVYAPQTHARPPYASLSGSDAQRPMQLSVPSAAPSDRLVIPEAPKLPSPQTAPGPLPGWVLPYVIGCVFLILVGAFVLWTQSRILGHF